MQQTIARRPVGGARPVRLRSAGARYGTPRRAAERRRAPLAAALSAYVLVGAFLGVVAWQLVGNAVETRELESFERPDLSAAPPPPPPTQFRDESLADVLRGQIPSVGTVGLYAKHLTSGAEANVNGDRVFSAASLYKLPIMAETIRQVRLRRLSLLQEVTIGREHWVPGSGVLQARVGERIAVQELLRLMIAESDNIAAMVLADLVGLDNVNLSMQGMGLRGTRLVDHRANGAYTGTGPYTITPADAGRLLDVVAVGKLVDPEGSEHALRLLEAKQGQSWLGDGLPWWAKVAHKWGEIPGARHDAGIVFTPNSSYVIVVMTEGLDPNGSATYIREVSRAVFRHFETAR